MLRRLLNCGIIIINTVKRGYRTHEAQVHALPLNPNTICPKIIVKRPPNFVNIHVLYKDPICTSLHVLKIFRTVHSCGRIGESFDNCDKNYTHINMQGFQSILGQAQRNLEVSPRAKITFKCKIIQIELSGSLLVAIFGQLRLGAGLCLLGQCLVYGQHITAVSRKSWTER